MMCKEFICYEYARKVDIPGCSIRIHVGYLDSRPFSVMISDGRRSELDHLHFPFEDVGKIVAWWRLRT